MHHFQSLTETQLFKEQVKEMLLLLLELPKGNTCLSFDVDPTMNRRSAFKSAAVASISSSAAVAAAGGATTGWLIPTTDDDAQALSLPSSNQKNIGNDSLLAYQVLPDATPNRNPKLKSVTVSERKDLWKYKHRRFFELFESALQYVGIIMQSS